MQCQQFMDEYREKNVRKMQCSYIFWNFTQSKQCKELIYGKMKFC